MSTVIRVEELSKRFKLGELDRQMLMAEWRRKLRGEKEAPNEIWALRDINVEIKDGDVVGVIGRNGSGKSTFLKILSRITAPTKGRLMIKGRIASLLEVGTGFHPDLTGRDNVYLNGVILGMTQKEVARKYDEIVAFAGVEKFMDTPVKHYSSGMRVRLAFAVAAHLEPEILVIDEVLAVGDQTFQQKCLGKLGEVARGGRTVLFVSHNAAAVENLCNRGMVLDHGRLTFVGTQTEAIHHYVNSERQAVNGDLRTHPDRDGTGELQIVGMELRDLQGRPISATTAGGEAEIWMHFENHSGDDFSRLIATITVRTEFEVPVFLQQNRLTGQSFGALPQRGALVCRLPRLPLPPSTYRVGYTLSSESRGGVRLDAIQNAMELRIEGGNFFGTGELPPVRAGVCLVEAAWRMEPAAPGAA